MASRTRTVLTNATNQENVKNLKTSVAAINGRSKRAALGEIGNTVKSISDVEPVDKTSLLPKNRNRLVPTVLQKQNHKISEQTTDKPPVQRLKPAIKVPIQSVTNVVQASSIKELVSFSSDLLPIEDVDEEDKNNPLLVSTYSNDIYEYLRTLENKFHVTKGYLAGQEVTPQMRSVLINWLVEVHQQFHLLQETLYLTVAIIDRFLQAFRSIDRKRLQLVGVTAMFIASKYEDIYSPEINDFVYITDKAYTKAEILQMEKVILKTLDYSFGRPVPLHFLRRYSKVGKALATHHTMAKYFLEQSLVYYEMCYYPPSLIAAAALYLAFIVIGKDDENEDRAVWTRTLAHYSTYSKDDIVPVVGAIANIIVKVDKSKHQAVKLKYGHSKYMKISIRPELRSPTLVAIAALDKEAV